VKTGSSGTVDGWTPLGPLRETKGQRMSQPAEQLWPQLLGVLGERNVPRWCRHHWRSSSRISSASSSLSNSRHSFLNALVIRKVCALDHVTHRSTWPSCARLWHVRSARRRTPERRTVVLSILMLATRAEENVRNRNTRTGGVHALPPVHDPDGPDKGRRLTLALRRWTTRTDPEGAIWPGWFGP